MSRKALIPLLSLLFAGPASLSLAATPLPWTATSVRGTAVYLASGEWQEVTRGVSLSDPALRTLRSGELILERSDVQLQIGPNSAVQFSTNSRSAATTIQQYAGALAISIADDAPSPIMVVAGTLIIVNIEGDIAVTMDQTTKRVDLVVKSGDVSVRTANRDFVSVAAGHVVTDTDGHLSVLVAEIATTSADGDKSARDGISFSTAGVSSPGVLDNGNGNNG